MSNKHFSSTHRACIAILQGNTEEEVAELIEAQNTPSYDGCADKRFMTSEYDSAFKTAHTHGVTYQQTAIPKKEKVIISDANDGEVFTEDQAKAEANGGGE